MRVIGIDIRDIEEGWAGRKRYTSLLLDGLLSADRTNRFVLFSRSLSDVDFNGNFSVVRFDKPVFLWHRDVIDYCAREVDVYISPRSPITPAFLNVRSILVVHDLISFTPFGKHLPLKSRIIEKIFMNRAVKKADVTVAVSENTKSDLIERFKIAEEKIRVIYEAPDPIFRKIDVSEEVLSRYGLEPMRYILFVGTLEPRKNVGTLIEAYTRLSPEVRDNFKLVIAGRLGWSYGAVIEKAESLSKQGKVVFTGYVPDRDLVHIYNGARLFVYPSLYEGFGLPVLEAMSCGVPVVSSDAASIPEIVGDTGISVPPLAVDEMSRAMEDILTDDEMWHILSEKALRRSKLFSWEATAKAFKELYKSL